MDSSLSDTTPLIKGLQEIFGHIFSVVGAGSCDDFHFLHSFQFFNDRVLMKSMVGLLIGGQLSMGVAGRHGWKPLGKPRVIDEVEGNVIKKIDGKSAISLYEEYFGESAQTIGKDNFGRMTILYPLGIYVQESNEYLLRNAVDVRPDGGIVCQGDLPVGMEVHVMIGNKLSCEQAATEAAQEAHRNLLGKKAKLVIILECLSRLKLFGRTAFQEVKKVKEVFGDDVPIVGMYTNGEIYPLQANERFKTSLHQNESIVVLALS